MRFFFETDLERLELLPTCTMGTVKCANCDEDHGTSFSIGWLFWTVGIGFLNDHSS